MTVAPSPRIAVISAAVPGSSCGIAEFVWDDLVSRGGSAELHEIEHAPAATGFDTVVLGIAIEDGRVRPEAVAYLRANLPTLPDKQVWLFGVESGVGHGPVGRWYPGCLPEELSEILDVVRPRDYIAFAGRDSSGAPSAVDPRVWPAVREWSDRIALAHDLPLATPVQP